MNEAYKAIWAATGKLHIVASYKDGSQGHFFLRVDGGKKTLTYHHPTEFKFMTRVVTGPKKVQAFIEKRGEPVSVTYEETE